MVCSHGLAYEVKCRQCVSEALERVILGAKTEGVKNPVPVTGDTDMTKGIQTMVDQIQH